MSATGFFRMKKLRGSGIILVAARHNRRAIQAEVGASASIDPIRSSLNQTLHGPPTPEGVALQATQRLREAGITKLRKDAVMGLEIVFSLPADSGIEEHRYFADCAAWAEQHFGGQQNILSVDVHRDEAAPHCHVLVQPMIGGRMVGSDLMGNRHKLKDLQQNFHLAVASRYGLKKAPARLSGASKLKAASAVMSCLKKSSDAALRSKVWPSIRDTIERDPGPYAQALNISLPAPTKKLRTLTQIFTSKGKGKNREDKAIGFNGSPATQPLCTVGFASEPATADAAALPETTRERDDDLDPASFDPETGEFHQRAAGPAMLKAEATAWVTTALAKLRDDASNDAIATPRRKG